MIAGRIPTLNGLRGLVIAALLATSVPLLATSAVATEIKTVTTPAGFKVWFVQETSIPIISLKLSFAGGSAMDPVGREGLANMASALYDEGAGDMASLEFQTRLEELAISLSFSASKDQFSVSLRTLTKNREEAFRLLGLALNSPRFDDKAIERIRGQILSGLEDDLESPRAIAAKLWYKTMFGDHVYGRPSSGDHESVAAITKADLRTFTKARFGRDNIIIGAVGDIDAGELARLLDGALGALPAQATPTNVPDYEVNDQGSLTIIRKPNPQSTVMFGMPGIRRDDPDYYAAYVMNYVLGGGGFTSRLYQEVREKRGLAYSVYSYLYPYEHSAIYLGGVATANARVAETLQVIKTEIERMAKDGVSADELSRAKVFLNGSFPLRLDSNAKIATMLTAIQISKLPIDYIDRRPGFINAVSIEDIQRVAKRLLRTEAITFVIVGDPKDIDG
jgi:zinc protease